MVYRRIWAANIEILFVQMRAGTIALQQNSPSTTIIPVNQITQYFMKNTMLLEHYQKAASMLPALMPRWALAQHKGRAVAGIR